MVSINDKGNKIRVIRIEDKEYPSNLREIHNPPKVIYVRGKLLPEDDNALAIVGARKCTEYGRKVTRVLATGVAQAGITIVSGLAIGLDTEAHVAAINNGSRTIAVLAGGLDSIHPLSNWDVAERILENGALISEYPVGTPPRKQSFPARNRIITGLSKGVLLTEATDKSGTLHTVNFALNQNRDVYVVPGPIDSPMSVLPNRLIKLGAKPITEVGEILEDFTC
jgi:DNA processing protein